MLEKLGYTVLVAGSSAEAFHIFANHNSEIDLVILDVVMPNSSVMDTYEKFRKTNSNINILFTSGYDINGIPMEIFKSGVIGFLPKPFRMKTLFDKLQAAFVETD
jgi:two-component system cell cycle sensor histidine kinase/response regulator CckA